MGFHDGTLAIDGSEAHQKVIAQGEIMTPKGKLRIMADGSYYYDNRTEEERRASVQESLKQWRKENPEQATANDLRSDNRRKYIRGGMCFQTPTKD